MSPLAFDIAHMFAGALVLVSFMMLYQDRLLPLINVLSLHSLLLALSVAWQAHIQEKPDLYVTAMITLGFKSIIIPMALRRMVVRMGLHREIEVAVGTGLTMLLGIGLVALSMDLMLRVTAAASALVREDVALSLSVVLLGLLIMVTRRNAVSQVIGFMSIPCFAGVQPVRIDAQLTCVTLGFTACAVQHAAPRAITDRIAGPA